MPGAFLNIAGRRAGCPEQTSPGCFLPVWIRMKVESLKLGFNEGRSDSAPLL
jgi:hypothetical protein